MPNRNYNRGRYYEYKKMKELREQGWEYIIRAAGSHGIFDIIAINQGMRKILLLQLKSGRTARRELSKLQYLSSFSDKYDVEARAE